MVESFVTALLHPERVTSASLRSREVFLSSILRFLFFGARASISGVADVADTPRWFWGGGTGAVHVDRSSPEEAKTWMTLEVAV